MDTVLHLFGEDITGVDGAGDVVDVHSVGLDAVMDYTVLEVDVVHNLGAYALRPVNHALVVICRDTWGRKHWEGLCCRSNCRGR